MPVKGKVERFVGYLKGSFFVPLDSRLRAGGIMVDAATANLACRRWLDEVANARVHATTGRVPAAVLAEERQYLLPLPAPWPGRTWRTLAAEAPRLPSELTDAAGLQHPLSVYDALLAEGAGP